MEPGYNKPIKGLITAGAGWAAFATLLGLVNELQLFTGIAGPDTYFSYGVLRPIYTTALLFGAGLSLFMGCAYYLVEKVEGSPLKFPPLGLAAFALVQLAVVLGIVTILLGHNKGREYGEMTFISDNLIALALLLFIVSIVVGVWGKTIKKPTMAALVAATGTLVVFFLGNLGQPNSPLSSIPMQAGLQDLSVQEYYRFGLLTFAILMPLFAVGYYFIPAYYKLKLHSESLASFQILGMLFMGALAGAAGTVWSSSPAIMQTVGLTAGASLMVAVLAGGVNIQKSWAGAEKPFRSDRFGLLFRYGFLLLILWAVARAVLMPRFMQRNFGFTAFNSLDISVDLQTYGLLILMGAAYVVAQSVAERGAPKLLVGLHSFFGITGALLVLVSSLGQGITQAVVSQAMTTGGQVVATSWSAVLYAGSLSSEGGPAAKYLLGFSGLRVLGFILMTLGLGFGKVAIVLTFMGKGDGYQIPDLQRTQGE